MYITVVPVINEKSNVTVTEGTSLDMICITRGDYFPEVTWWRASKVDGQIEDGDSVFVCFGFPFF